MTVGEVVEYRACWAEQLSSVEVREFERLLKGALAPILAELPDSARSSLFRDARGILLWHHINDVQMALNSPPA
ncbi:MAG: hypothetical protein K2P94_16935, partial [Rhodospirillaceae bacterium]|nr:hypothetical protein [Rhodospirillaceae bacterium]